MGNKSFSIKCLLLVVALVFFNSCSTQKETIKGEKESPPPPTRGAVIEPTNLSAKPGKFWIMRPDGSKSCGAKKGISSKQAAQELEKEGVKIFKHRTAPDGRMHMMVCGADTGNRVELLIDGEGLPIAGQKGYRMKDQD